MLRFRSNCSVTIAEPSELDDVIWFTPAMRPNCRSSGVATADAIVSGLAPGNPAPTPMTGKSTSGSEATGSTRIRHRARQQQGQAQQRSGDRPLDKGCGKMHRVSLSLSPP